MKKVKVFINANIVTIFEKIIFSEKIENNLIEPEKIYKQSQNEIEYLRRQNEDLQNDNRNLVSMVMKLQNDINGYIKQIGEGSREPGNNLADIILKTVLAIALLVLVWYLVFG
jgi:predicted RNase H-like nuclease (RuvC/YqgF family)